jgi:hypothetical protein
MDVRGTAADGICKHALYQANDWSISARVACGLRWCKQQLVGTGIAGVGIFSAVKRSYCLFNFPCRGMANVGPLACGEFQRSNCVTIFWIGYDEC